MPTGSLNFDDGLHLHAGPLRAARPGTVIQDRQTRPRRSPGRLMLLARLGALRIVLGSLILIGAIPTPAMGAAPRQDIDDETFADRPISEVEFKGLERVEMRLVQNNIRTASGQPFDAQSLRDDVATLYRLGQFQTVTADAVLEPDGSVKVIYRVTEQSIIRDVQTVGNTLVSDQELRAQIPLYAGGPRDDFLVEQSLLRIKDLYRSKGHYLAEVRVDDSRLTDAGILIFVIVEGPRVRIKNIEFVGNRNVPANILGSQIATKPAILFFRKGELDPNLLIDDAATLDKFYKDRGWIDVRVDSRVLLGPDSKEAKVVFVIDEGRQYRLRRIDIASSGGDESPLDVFTNEQLLALAKLRPGDPYEKPRVDRTVDTIRNAYIQMGFIDARVTARSLRVGEQPEVDMIVQVVEGESSTAGLIMIQGNFLTKDKVIRRLVKVRPGRPLDGTLADQAEISIQRTQLFNDARVSIQQPTPDAPRVRDIIIEVKEKNTGSFNFGAGLASDAGVFGEFSFRQTNFDVADFPLSVEELISGRAFRGAGQGFNITIAPGTEVSMYTVSITEPHLFESNISGQFDSYYRNRIYNQYTEERLSAGGNIGQRLGDVWVGNVSGNVQRVKLTNFDSDTPIQVYEDRGPDVFALIGGGLRRTTVDNPFRPGKGSVINLGLAKAIPLSGNVDYWRVNAELASFLTLYEDFLGRKHVLKLRTEAGWIFEGEAPTFEKYYLGGRTFRGFQFRTVSPKSDVTVGTFPGGTGDFEPVGGSWLFFAGAQYEVPLFGESLAGVMFVDSGTVSDTPGFDDYRVSVGVGLRIYLPVLGPAPLAFDFGFPLVKQEYDETQVFSFSAELPF
ncbi:BamA/TamA family outer membrane protein [bacterium]|nr:BamA/TamA family outer membrane protein [bacterium]